MKKLQQGFTIVEIVVALVVLGILMGAMVMQLNRFRTTAYQTAANNIALSTQQAINMKYASIAQVMSTSANLGSCTPSPCQAAYTAAFFLLRSTEAGSTYTTCGLTFNIAEPGPFRASANLGGGWSINGAATILPGAPMPLIGPDTVNYRSEIPLLSAAAFCDEN